MPNSASAKKRHRQSEDRRLANRSKRSTVRTLVKKVRAAIDSGDVAKSEAAFQAAQKKLDQAAAHNLIHDNAAARTKARLSKAIKELKAGASA